MTRVGLGYDIHRFQDGRRLRLAGVDFPGEVGLEGHSDADVALHAVADALLGAAALGDIGDHFPPGDPRWKDVDSRELLRAVTRLLAGRYRIVNVDLTIVLERPKIRDYVDAMRAAMANAIGIDPLRVSVKGKTNEGVDAVGRGEAIAAHAVAVVRLRQP